MIDFIIANMAPLMFASLVVILLLGYPVAFALAFVGLSWGLVGIELGLFPVNLFQALPPRILGVLNNETLLAIPFFTFMGIVLERSGMAEDLLDTIGQLFGPIRGGLAYAVVFVGALLAATTGVVAASVIAMGLISLPIMLRYGYDRRLASGVIAASGTLAQIIPPSLVLIVLADQLGRPVGDMYKGAIIPGLVLSGLYMLYVLTVSIIFPKRAPALPIEARNLGSGVTSLLVAALLTAILAFGIDWWPLNLVLAGFASPPDILNGLDHFFIGLTQRGSEGIAAVSVAFIAAYVVALANRTFNLPLLSRLAQQTILVLMPPLALIFLVLGTIFIGIATPTEGGAMGAVGALVLAAAKGRLRFPLIVQALDTTTKLSAFVIFILIGARVFSLTFYGVDGHIWVEHLLTSLPGGAVGFLIVVNTIVFLLAFFLDFFELAFIIVPLLAPAAAALGIDLIWFGVLLGVNMQTSFMHPPFGFALFYLRSVAPRTAYPDRVTGATIQPISTGQIYWGAVPFVVIQVIMIGITITFPGMVLHYKDTGPKVDPSTLRLEGPAYQGGPNFGGGNGGPSFGTPPAGGGGGGPNFGAPPAGGTGGGPNFGAPPAGGSGAGGTGSGPNFGAPPAGGTGGSGSGAGPNFGAPPPGGAAGSGSGPNFGTPPPAGEGQ